MEELKTPFELFWYECDKGWYSLVNEAQALVDEWNEQHKDGDETDTWGGEKLEITQAKEKWGELCIYCNFYPEGFHEKLWELEDRSSKVCEMCGETDGTTCKSSHGWIYTLCPECRRKEEKRWNNLFKKY